MARARLDPFMRDMTHPVRPTRLGATVILLVLIVLSLAALVPLYWMFATSLTPSAMTVKLPPELIPTEPTLDNYSTVLRQPNFGRWVFNSLVQALSVTAVTVATASMAGYALAKLPFRGSRTLFWLFIMSMMLPFEAILVPLFLVVTRLGMVDTYLGLLLPLMVSPFSIFLMKQFIQTLPSEAARRRPRGRGGGGSHILGGRAAPRPTRPRLPRHHHVRCAMERLRLAPRRHALE